MAVFLFTGNILGEATKQRSNIFLEATRQSPPTATGVGSRPSRRREFICKACASQPKRFKLNPLQKIPGLLYSAC